VTNNSLAANQRPNISLIDRRLSVARRVPCRVRLNAENMLGKKQGHRRHLTLVSHINVVLCGGPALTVELARRWRPVRSSYGLGATPQKSLHKIE